MELRHLRYFIAVAEEQNVTRAARNLHISQPPLTRQIHDLEEELGVVLFERKGKSILLTHAGEIFLHEARLCLKRIEEAIGNVRSAAAVAPFQLGYAPSPTVEILPKLLRHFEKRFPNIPLILHDHSSPEMIKGLLKGALHAALMMQPPQNTPGLIFEKLATYPVGIAVPLGHPLTGKKRVAMQEIEDEQIVAYSRSQFPDYYAFLSRVLGKSASRLALAHQCDSGASLAAAVEAGRGICVTGSFLTAGVGHRLKFIPLHPDPPPAVVGIAFRKNNIAASLQSLVEIARGLKLS